jgi:hypothetical protein
MRVRGLELGPMSLEIVDPALERILIARIAGAIR